MQNYWLLIVKLMVIKIIVQGKEENCACPLWTTQQNGTCKCDDLLKGLVKCEDGKGAQAVVKCFCMTTQENNNSSPVVGSCLYTCTQWDSTTFIALNTNSSEDLNNKTCGPFHRTGVLCSKCVEGYGLPVYSYSLSCVECTEYKYNWIKYIAVAYGPLTLFYILAILFRISATSGLMACYVTICQMLTIRGLRLWVANIRPTSWISMHGSDINPLLLELKLFSINLYPLLPPPKSISHTCSPVGLPCGCLPLDPHTDHLLVCQAS